MCEPQMGSEVWWGNLSGSPVQPGVEKGGGREEKFGNYCCYFKTQIAEIGEIMIKNLTKITKEVITGTS